MSIRRSLFASFIQAGFECSTHRYGERRLDLLAQTRHDELTLRDFERLRPFGIRTVRTAARWHRIEAQPGVYDFASLDLVLDAAEATGTELILDLLHFGWPDYRNILDPEFPAHFGRFVRATAQYLRSRNSAVCTAIAPVNEISFLSWVAGDVGCVFPHLMGQGGRMKEILVRTAIAGSAIVLQELPGTRLVAPEPVIHIVGNPAVPGDDREAEGHTRSQFEAWDMLSGSRCPELGGRSEYLDIVGVNFYERNQWVNYGEPLKRTDPRYRPFRDMLKEVWRRYRRPLYVSETGTEDAARPEWFRYICAEVDAARQEGVPVEGICLYPILNHPGWEDDRYCQNGLFDYAEADGHRPVYQPLADEIVRQQSLRPRHDISFHDLQPA